MSDHDEFMREAIALARDNIGTGGTAYGAVVVRDGAALVRVANQVHTTNDPTAHAELLALREAGRVLGRATLDDCIVYASGRPCPMCHAAMRLAGIREAYFAFSAEEAEANGAGSAGIYAELCRPLAEQPMQVRQLTPEGERAPYAEWAARRNAAG